MWIKTQEGGLVNADRISFLAVTETALNGKGSTNFEYKVSGIVAEAVNFAATEKGQAMSGAVRFFTFKTRHEAQKYLDKLAKKLGAEEIKIDDD